MEHDVQWLLKISCVEFFGDGKYGLFLKELMERWYLLGIFELSMMFQDLENMVFAAVNQEQNKPFTWKMSRNNI